MTAIKHYYTVMAEGERGKREVREGGGGGGGETRKRRRGGEKEGVEGGGRGWGEGEEEGRRREGEERRRAIKHPCPSVTSCSACLHTLLISELRSLTLGAHAQEGYGTCLCLCVCVTTLAATSVVSTLKMRYVGVCLRLFSVFNSWIFDKPFRSEVMARKSQYANEQLPLATISRY